MQDGAEIENKPSIMHENIRNLRKSSHTDKLWFIDNESGLIDAYELLGQPSKKFYNFHEQILKTTCIFHERTIRKISQLVRLSDPFASLLIYASEQEPLFDYEYQSHDFSWVNTKFHERLKKVLNWVENCVKR